MDNKEMILRKINEYNQELSNMRMNFKEDTDLYKFFKGKVSGLELALEILEGKWN